MLDVKILSSLWGIFINFSEKFILCTGFVQYSEVCLFMMIFFTNLIEDFILFCQLT